MFLYFIITGVYFCRINIDAYVVQISSFRTLSGLFSNKNDIDIAHNMIKEYTLWRKWEGNKKINTEKARKEGGIKNKETENQTTNQKTIRKTKSENQKMEI